MTKSNNEQLFFKKLKLLIRFWKISQKHKERILSKSEIIKLLRMNRNQLFKSELSEYLDELLNKYTKSYKYKRAILFIFEREIKEDDIIKEIRGLLSLIKDNNQ